MRASIGSRKIKRDGGGLVFLIFCSFSLSLLIIITVAVVAFLIRDYFGEGEEKMDGIE